MKMSMCKKYVSHVVTSKYYCVIQFEQIIRLCFDLVRSNKVFLDVLYTLQIFHSHRQEEHNYVLMFGRLCIYTRFKNKQNKLVVTSIFRNIEQLLGARAWPSHRRQCPLECFTHLLTTNTLGQQGQHYHQLHYTNTDTRSSPARVLLSETQHWPIGHHFGISVVLYYIFRWRLIWNKKRGTYSQIKLRLFKKLFRVDMKNDVSVAVIVRWLGFRQSCIDAKVLLI